MISEHDIARILHGARDLAKRTNESAEDDDVAIGEDVELGDFIIIAMMKWTDDEDKEREAPVMWSERKSQWMKIGLIEAARIDMANSYDEE